MTGWCGKQRLKILWAYDIANCQIPKWTPLYLSRHIETVTQNRTECSFMFPIAVQCSYQLQDQILNVLCGKITHRHSLHCFLMVSLHTELGVAYSCLPIILCLFHQLLCRSSNMWWKAVIEMLGREGAIQPHLRLSLELFIIGGDWHLHDIWQL